MLSLLDILYAIVREIKGVIPESKHYIMKLPENFKEPCFAYYIVFNGDKKSSAFVKDCTLDLQIIYFGENDKYGNSNFEDKLRTLELLKKFLSLFCIKVKDRCLTFEYSFKEVDEQLSVDLSFKFKDNIVEILEDDLDLIQEINFNKEVI